MVHLRLWNFQLLNTNNLTTLEMSHFQGPCIAYLTCVHMGDWMMTNICYWETTVTGSKSKLKMIINWKWKCKTFSQAFYIYIFSVYLCVTNATPVSQWWEGCCLPLGYHSITQERNIPLWIPSTQKRGNTHIRSF